MSKNTKKNTESITKSEILEHIENLRSTDTDFDSLVSEIDLKLKRFISEKNSIKSYNPKKSTDFSVNLKVTAVPITGLQKEALLNYLGERYMSSVFGNSFTLTKCWFSNEYRLKSIYIPEDL